MANDTVKIYDWDDEIENDGPVYTLLPEGTYPYTVIALERGEHPGSAKLPPCPKATVTCEIDGGDKGMAQVKRALFLCSKMEGMLCAFFSSIGDRKHGEKLRMNWRAVEGKKGWCKVGIRKYKKDNGDEGEANEITAFVDPPKQGGYDF